MTARPQVGVRLTSLAMLIAPAMTGCNSDDPAALQPAPVASIASSPMAAQSVDPVATPTVDRIERVAAPPPPAPSPSATIHPHKDFVDPPLPAELQDNGALKPLPPPPAQR